MRVADHLLILHRPRLFEVNDVAVVVEEMTSISVVVGKTTKRRMRAEEAVVAFEDCVGEGDALMKEEALPLPVVAVVVVASAVS